jgi:hypothetical protein
MPLIKITPHEYCEAKVKRLEQLMQLIAIDTGERQKQYLEDFRVELDNLRVGIIHLKLNTEFITSNIQDKT